MSKNVKVMKPKKKFNWGKVYYYIRSLWNNSVALECGLKHKWFVAVILALFSVIVSAIPLVVHTATGNGSTFISRNTIYNYDEGLYSFLEDAKANNYNIKFDETNNTATLENATTTATKNYLLYQHENKALDGHANARIDFQVFYIPQGIDYATTQTTIAALDPNEAKGRNCSYIIFGYQNFTSALYSSTSTSVASSLYGNYKHLAGDYKSVLDFYVSSETTRLDNVSKTLTNFKGFADRIYIDNRSSLSLVQTGLIFAVNSSVVLLMGMVLFLMTRGKNNPNRSIKFQQCYNIGYWATLSPAIIALVLGFLLPGYEVMLFVVTYGFRVMWLSMKQFQPALKN